MFYRWSCHHLHQPKNLSSASDPREWAKTSTPFLPPPHHHLHPLSPRGQRRSPSSPPDCCILPKLKRRKRRRRRRGKEESRHRQVWWKQQCCFVLAVKFNIKVWIWEKRSEFQLLFDAMQPLKINLNNVWNKWCYPWYKCELNAQMMLWCHTHVSGWPHYSLCVSLSLC